MHMCGQLRLWIPDYYLAPAVIARILYIRMLLMIRRLCQVFFMHRHKLCSDLILIHTVFRQVSLSRKETWNAIIRHFKLEWKLKFAYLTLVLVWFQV